MYTPLVKYTPFSGYADLGRRDEERPPSGLERLWRRDELERKPRLGLSLERVVRSGVELADADGLAAVSMKRVAERLGFTTMSLYRYVSSKDELLLLMQDSSGGRRTASTCRAAAGVRTSPGGPASST